MWRFTSGARVLVAAALLIAGVSFLPHAQSQQLTLQIDSAMILSNSGTVHLEIQNDGQGEQIYMFRILLSAVDLTGQPITDLQPGEISLDKNVYVTGIPVSLSASNAANNNWPWNIEPKGGLYGITISVTDDRYFNGKNGPFGGVNMPRNGNLFILRARMQRGSKVTLGQTIVHGGSDVER